MPVSYPTCTPEVLDVLARHHAHGTFFVLGNEVLRHPDLVRRAVAEGNEIGNHLDGRDWERPGVNAIVRNSTPKNGQGSIVLLHDAGGERSQTVEALDVLIPKLQAQGYRFATLNEALGLSRYHDATSSELAQLMPHLGGLAAIHPSTCSAKAVA
jgi:peptidoglycan/xylan/chitin deacetylase (PgdA/CDA1 family)